MFVASQQGTTELAQEFTDPLWCPGRGDADILDPAEIQNRSKHAHKRDDRNLYRGHVRHP